MSRRLVLVLAASAAIAAGLLLVACGGGRQGHQRQGRRRQLRRHRVLGQRPPRQADRLRPAAAGRLRRALQADERRDRPGDGAQGLAGRQHRGRLPGLRRLPGLDRRVGREPLPVQRRRLRRRPRRDRRDRHLQLRLRAGHDPDPEQGARRRPADGLARQHPGLPDGAEPELCKPDEPDVYYPSGTRNYVRVVPNDAVQVAGLASFANEQGIHDGRSSCTPPTTRPARARPTPSSGAARKLGMNIAGTAQWDPKATELHRA